jgi:hypothetical protein
MSYKTFVSMNIAIIGVSEIAAAYALAFAHAGHEVFLAWKNGEKEKVSPILLKMDGIHVCTIEQAADISDLVILATRPEDLREVSYWLGDVRHKIIIDASSNVNAGGDEKVSANAIRSITGSQNIVQVFHTKGYEQILKPLFSGEPFQLIIAGECKKAKEITKIFAQDLGISRIKDLGGKEAVPLFNAMTTCWREMSVSTGSVAGRKAHH